MSNIPTERQAQAVRDVDGPPRDVTTLKLRDEWVRLAAIQTLRPILRVVGMRLAHFYNGKTGQLNPSYPSLAKECGVSERTAQRAVAAFRKLGMIAETRVSGGRHDITNDFVLIIPRQVSNQSPVKPNPRVSTGTPVKPQSGAPTGDRSGSRRVTRSVFDGCPASHPNSVRENSVRNSGRGKAARTADDVRLSASNSTTDDATITEPSVARADALRETVAEPEQQSPVPARQPKPSRDNRIGTAANGAGADGFDAMRKQFEKIRGIWPPGRIGDEGEAYQAFCRALDARGDLTIVIKATRNLLFESGAENAPSLSEALTMVERGE